MITTEYEFKCEAFEAVKKHCVNKQYHIRAYDVHRACCKDRLLDRLDPTFVVMPGYYRDVAKMYNILRNL